MKNRFIPKQRTALDGKIWWCVWDNAYNKWATYIKFKGKYKTKKSCQNAIDYECTMYNLI